MRKLLVIAIILFLGAFNFSCTKAGVHGAKHIEGTWELQEMSYHENARLIKLPIGTPAPKLIFMKEGKSTYETKSALQIIGKDTIPFAYNIGGDIGISINVDEIEKRHLPLLAIGRDVAYQYTFSGKRKLEFTIENEYDYIGEQVLKDVRYVYKK